ncbi:MAG: T9SS type A sorting domain-containing protein [Bacteroidia bacterium]
MKHFFFLLMTFMSLKVTAQTGSNFYGLARSSAPGTVYLATVDPATGQVTNISSSSLSSMINLTGAALDPYRNSYHYIGYNSMISVDLTTGALISSVTLNNPGASNVSFDNFRFNNSDSSLYGLSRLVVYDSVTNTYTSSMYLATADPTTGVVTNISPSSIGQGFALAGSAIDPWQMVYYYSTGADLVGLDMYTGLVWTSAPITIAGGDMFDNFTYSCADSGLYGLVRTNYFDTVYNPFDSTVYNLILDSATLRLGKINPATGVVTIISPYSIMQGGYSLNAGSTIDPNTMTYYYNNGQDLVGVSMATGLIVSQQILQNANGDYFDLMRIPANCIQATQPIRLAPAATSVNEIYKDDVFVMPNPVVDKLQVMATDEIDHLDILNLAGTLLYSEDIHAKKAEVDFSSFSRGVYFVRCYNESGVSVRKVVR